MHFEFQPQFQHKKDEPRYFVRSLDQSDTRYVDGYRYQIQFLNENEEGESSIEFRPEDNDFSAFPLYVPLAVVDAARNGVSDYVDEQGNCRLPGFLGGHRTGASNKWFG